MGKLSLREMRRLAQVSLFNHPSFNTYILGRDSTPSVEQSGVTTSWLLPLRGDSVVRSHCGLIGTRAQVPVIPNHCFEPASNPGQGRSHLCGSRGRGNPGAAHFPNESCPAHLSQVSLARLRAPPESGERLRQVGRGRGGRGRGGARLGLPGPEDPAAPGRCPAPRVPLPAVAPPPPWGPAWVPAPC